MNLAHPDRTPHSELPTDPFTGSRYRALSIVAKGEFGDVYVVQHRDLGRRFAAKLLHTDLLHDSRTVDRWRLEAQSLGRLNHPNIVAITGFERTTLGVPFVVMELLKGITLKDELLQRGRLPLVEAIEFGIQILSGLAAAHAIGIIHRDISSQNIMLLGARDGIRSLKLLDFGSVRVQVGLSEDAPSPLAISTATGPFAGTIRVCSPEGLAGRPLDARTDIFQVGQLLRLMVAGTDCGEPMPALAPITLPAPAKALERILRRALAVEPLERFQTAQEFRRQLQLLQETVQGGERLLDVGKEPTSDRAALRHSDFPTKPQAHVVAVRIGLYVLCFFSLATIAAWLVVKAGHYWELRP